MIVQSLERLIKSYPKILFHIFLIAVIFSFWITYNRNPTNRYTATQLLMYGSVYAIIVYSNVFYLFPNFFLKGRVFKYLVLSLLSFFAGYSLMQWILYPDWTCFSSYIGSSTMFTESSAQLMKYAAFSGLGITYTLFMRWQEGEKKITTLKNINLNAELENLKKQISPHFLFNTLNNLYVLIKTDPATAAETTLHLSELLRYQLYECSSEKVPLHQEIACIKGLIYIEQLRKKNWTFHTDIPIEVPANIYIPPLTFVTLVENAIKHGSQKLETGNMDIHFAITEQYAIFSVANTTPVKADVPKNPSSGIGLTNLEKRLSLLYPGRYEILTDIEPQRFLITLKLPYEVYCN